MSLAAPRVRLNLPQAFVVSYLVWLLPGLVRWLTGFNVATRVVAYGAAWSFILFVLALAAIANVYRVLSARRCSFVFAASVSVLSTIPVVALAYVVDMLITKADPSLSCILMLEQTATLGTALATSLADGIGICLLLAAVVFLPVFARAHQERLRELELVQRDADLLRVRAHLEPHFVLNSLNAVAGMLEEEPAQARELLAALGDLFRDAVRCRATHRVADEIEWLRRYVMIHELRHPDMLRASWEVDEDCLDLECPALILQPLVENAVKHGALRGGGHLVVRSSCKGGVLAFTVEDDGPELGGPRDGGQGLSIVRRRLALEELPESAFELVREAGRTIARVCLPVRAHHA
ncbi:MAG: histidine kinase [Labilithrix sp.]|nr:histidine kinase [Labilithrix sp.]MCW5816253.1 histidine kinase [Labilithrix sp.]